ncbi:unnamed protein product [Somion occarium]|uniref:DUF7702 domain-containing protein n=1 Tax=Somion occarium TaxID=3059160 RepID=A0ABP1CNA7_9APHY
MGLDARGIIAIVEIVLYVPILATSAFLTLRHGLARTSGWIFLVILSIIRIVGGSIHLASEVGDPNNITLKIVFSILEGAGLSPLLLATIGFLVTVAQHAFEPSVTRALHLFGMLSGTSLALTIVGGTKIANADGDESKLNSGATLRHVGAILFLVLYILLFFVHGFYWTQKHKIMKYRRKLLAGVSTALPFLGVRVLYSVLSAFSPVLPNSAGGLSKFNSSTGAWEIYFFMGIVAEFIVVSVYTFVGIRTPLQEDYSSTRGMTERWAEDEEDSQYMMSKSGQYGNP